MKKSITLLIALTILFVSCDDTGTSGSTAGNAPPPKNLIHIVCYQNGISIFDRTLEKSNDFFGSKYIDPNTKEQIDPPSGRSVSCTYTRIPN